MYFGQLKVFLQLFLSCAGRGVFLLEEKKKNDFLVEYTGELIDAKEGYKREEREDDQSVFRYYLSHNGNKLW